MTTRGISNNNPLNIKRNPRNKWQGKDEPPRDKTFETFRDPIMGLRAGAVLIVRHFDRRRADTVRKLIRIWAPPGKDRNPATAYFETVAKRSGFGVDEGLDFHRYEHLRPVFVEMIRFENGEQPYTPAQIDKALVLAGVQAPMRSLGKTRTVKGGTVAALTALTPVVAGVADAVAPTLPVLDWVRDNLALSLIAVGVVVIVAVGWMVWARLDDRNKGLR